MVWLTISRNLARTQGIQSYTHTTQSYHAMVDVLWSAGLTFHARLVVRGQSAPGAVEAASLPIVVWHGDRTLTCPAVSA